MHVLCQFMHRGGKHDEYVAWSRDVGRSSATVALDQLVASRFSRLAEVPIDAAGPADVDRWWSALRGCCAQTRATYLRSARRYWRWAGVDPSAHLAEPRVPRGLPRPVPERDVMLALAVTGGDVRVQLALAAYAGLRVSEIARLSPGDVHGDGDGRLWLLVRGKGERCRDVPVVDALEQLLAGYSWPDTTGRALTQRLRRALHRVGLPYSAHQLRHYYATAVLAADRDVVAVQRLLGHASVSTTMVYADVSSQRLWAAAHAAFGTAAGSCSTGAGPTGASGGLWGV